MRNKQLLALAGVLAGVTLGAPRGAQACGCFSPPDPTVPIVQAGERILFAHADGKVTAHIQIQYQGDASEFGWILPLPAIPTMKLGTQELFDQLIATTQPKYVLRTIYDESCNDGTRGGNGSFGPSAGGAGAGGSSAGGEDSGPLVLRDAIGPYEYAVLRADDRQAMFDWLAANRFFVPAGTENVVGPYIHPGAFFLALKLRSGQSAGDLQPVVVEYASDRAMIPLILTSVAANPNMGVQVWVAGDHRAIPVNYRHTVLNEAQLDWQSGAQNYLEVMTRAANEAPDGQSFVTEYAGTSSVMRGILNYQGRFGSLAELSNIQTASAFVRYLDQNGYAVSPPNPNNGGFGGPGGPGFGRAAFDSVLRGILKPVITMPAALRAHGITEDEFYARLPYYLNEYRQFSPEDFVGWMDVIDGAAVTATLNEKIVTPTLAAGALFDANPYLSRLFTFLDPQEMTVDPVFDFNPNLPEWSKDHTATQTISCLRTGPFSAMVQASVIRLPNGRRLFLRPEESPSVWSRLTMPQSQRIERMPLEGAPAVETDNTSAIDRIIEARNKSIAGEYDAWNWGPTVMPAADPNDPGSPSDGIRAQSSGCSMDARRNPSALPVLGLLGLVALWAMRRRRS